MDNNNAFTKDHTEVAKGIAIILMLTHHLFAFPDRIKIGEYISILEIKNINLEFFIGGFGKICVGMYLFLSGYGMYFVLRKKGEFKFIDSYNQLKKLYFNYWIVFILFIPITFIFSYNKFDLFEFILNFIGLGSTYNKEWWFFRVYVELIILFPVMHKMLGSRVVLGFIKTFSIFSLAFAFNVTFKVVPELEFIKQIWIYNEVYNVLLWQCTFSVGYLCAKFDLYKRIKQLLYTIKLDNKIFYITSIILIVVVRRYKGYEVFKDPILVPILIFAVVNILYKTKVQKIFNYLAKHSTNIWLTHTFFCYYYFQRITFYPKVSVLILIWLIALSLSASHVINYILKYIDSKYRNLSINKLSSESLRS